MFKYNKVLIIVKFRSRSVIQAVATVQWTGRSPGGLSSLGLEMTGLSDHDLNVLIHECTLAQRSLGAEPSGEFRDSHSTAASREEHLT